MYSGSGFSGRTLVNGAVDGWSFTQFETAQVGGMGEGVEPCTDAIYYMPERLSSVNVDFNKCLRNIGEGTSSIPLIVRFDNPTKIDNVVLSLNFNSELPSASDVLALLNNDPAFNWEGNTLNIDADGDGIFNNSSYDANRSGEWTLTEYEDCLLLSCSGEKPNYLLYLPVPGEVTAVIPEEMTFALSDEKNYIPVFTQRAATYDTINYAWYRRSDTASTHTSTSNDIVKSISATAASLGQLTYAGNKASDLYIHVKVRTGKGASYSYSNLCHFTLLPPEIPIESISFATESVEAPLNATIENEVAITPENATYTALTYSTSDNTVATASATAIKTTKTAGNATITVASTWNPNVNGQFEIVSALRNPVTDFTIKGVEGDVITLNPKEMIGIIADVTPADADIPDFEVTLTDNGTDKSDYIASMYKVNYWDENNTRIQFYELSGHRIGECTLTLTSTDGSNTTKTYQINVEEQDRTPLEDGYVDGTLVINEEWFGHTNGGMNYITPKGEMMYQVYERENPGMSFGCTSQYATIWADKLIAVSKQAVDNGDPLPGGGRVVVADAKTLKRQGSIDDLMFGDETTSADGRAVAGATPDKAYVSTSNGIYIVDLNEVKVIGKIKDFDKDEATSTDLYNGQIGDMIHAGKYVFGIKQNTGGFAIDTEIDQVIKTYPYTTVQGVTQTADGHVWLATVVDGTKGRFVCIDPETLEEVEDMSVTFPEDVDYPVCSWGAWRNTPFVGSHSRNTIWFSVGGGIAGGSSTDKYYGWDVGTDPTNIIPVFDMGKANLVGSNPAVSQKTYGTLRYDDRSNELIVMTTDDKSSGHYRYNWIHFINPKTGEITHTIALRPYYWFQAFAIFPDKYDADIDLETINISVKDGEREYDLTNLVTDADNIDSNINLSLVEQPTAVSETDSDSKTDSETENGTDNETDNGTIPEAHAEITLTGKTLKISPKSVGTEYFTLEAESNGRIVTKTVLVNVTDIDTGVSDIYDESHSIVCDGQRIFINGFAENQFHIYDISGRLVNSFFVDSENYVFDFGNHHGVYVIGNKSGFYTKVIIK
jgi:hypothetical protein